MASEPMASESDLTNIVDVEMLRLNLGALGEDAAECLSYLTDIFLEDTPALLQRLQLAIADNNASEARAAAHNLKSNSATLGITYMSTLSAQMEDQAREQNLAGAPELANQIIQEFERAKVALKDIQL